MKIQVSNCLDCPFISENIDWNSSGKEVCVSCSLLHFLRLERMNYQLYRYFDYEEWFNQHYLEPLKECPLKNIDKIEIGYEKT